MDLGRVINGYRILQEFTTAGGGLCRWTFVEKDGKAYFLKEFLSPKYPTEGSPGSAIVKAQKRKRCEQFELHHKMLTKAIAASVGDGGNLVATKVFFRSGTTYYKVTEKVDVSSLTPEDISKVPIGQRILVLKTVAHSLKILHQHGIVHGDLKPDNILIKRKEGSAYIAKLIDFDDSYFAKSAPEISDETDIVGTPDYYSPELGRYIKRDTKVTASDLDTISDIFALGVIYSQYLTGKKPLFDSKYRYAWEAAIHRSPPHVKSEGLPSTLVDLIDSMLHLDPAKRPDIRAVFLRLQNWDKLEKVSEKSKSRLTGTAFRRSAALGATGTPAPAPPDGPVKSESRLRGTLIKKKKS